MTENYVQLRFKKTFNRTYECYKKILNQKTKFLYLELIIPREFIYLNLSKKIIKMAVHVHLFDGCILPSIAEVAVITQSSQRTSIFLYYN